MWIVLIDTQRHSAWRHFYQANHQREVLQSYGYRHVKLTWDVTTEVANGYYYV